MTIGIIILCTAILLIFFGLTEKFFRRLGIANWLAFLLVLALVIGAIIPNISIGNHFIMNVSGFLIPIAIMVLFEVLIGWNIELFRAFLAQISVAAVTITVRLLMPDNTTAMQLTTSLIIGFLGGISAYLSGQTRMPIIVGSMGGIVIGDVIVNFIQRYVYNVPTMSLGTGGVFNSIIIALVFGLILLEVMNAMLRAMNRKRLNIGALGFEAGEDIQSERDKKIEKNINKKSANDIQSKDEYGDYNDYFDDKFL